VVESVVASEMPDYPEHWMVSPDGSNRILVESQLVHERLVLQGWTHDTEMRVTD